MDNLTAENEKQKIKEQKRKRRLIQNEINAHIACAQTEYIYQQQNSKKFKYGPSFINNHHQDILKERAEKFVEIDSELQLAGNFSNIIPDPENSLTIEPGITADADETLNRHEIDDILDISTNEKIDLNELLELKQWALNRDIDDKSVDELLLILRKRLLPELPKTAKTFLNVQYNYKIKKIHSDDQEMSYVYFGLEESLTNILNPALHENKKIVLQINIDGMSLFKSNNTQFWPILVKIFHEADVYQPFVLAILESEGKPSNADEYLTEFVNDVNHVMEAGLVYGEKKYEVSLMCFICDTPARAFLKYSKGHGGYYACERCNVKGLRKDRRTTYPDCEATPRTDETFRRKDCEGHHVGTSPLLQITPPVNMVVDFILDSMHLKCNGAMLKLLYEYWIKGKRKIRLTKQQQKEVSRRLKLLKSCIPKEFQRKPRGLKYVSQWKATELRFFLLYCGVLILQDLLKIDLYKHFLLLHVSSRILCSDDFKTKSSMAKAYLLKFFKAMRFLYGKQSMIMNIHNLLHVTDDAINMNCNLSKISAFPFENALGKLRKFVRTPNKPLSQVCRKLERYKNFQSRPPDEPKRFVILKSERDKNTVFIKEIKIKNAYTITDKHPNNYILTNSGKVLKINKMFFLRSNPRKIKVSGIILKKKRSAFTYPIKSSKLNICEVTKSKRKLITNMRSIQTKLVFLSFNRSPNGSNKNYVLPFLH